MKHSLAPYFWVGDLENALILQFGQEFMDEVGHLRSFLFDTNYMNDVSIKYYIDELEEFEGFEWQDEQHIRLENCIKTFLRDMFPGHDYVLVDVMW